MSMPSPYDNAPAVTANPTDTYDRAYVMSLDSALKITQAVSTKSVQRKLNDFLGVSDHQLRLLLGPF